MVGRATWARALGVGVPALGGVFLLASQAGSSGSPSRTDRSNSERTEASLAVVSVRRPTAPSPYRVPTHALRVSSSRELVTALARHSSTDIVLAPGVYDNARPFSDRYGHRLYAARLGRVVLKAGIVLGANEGPGGALVRGIRFDVARSAKTLHGAIIHVWGSARNAHVLDTWLDGNGIVAAGVVVKQPEGFVARRLAARAFRSYGVLVDPNDYDYRARLPYVLEDLNVSNVVRPVPGSSNGTAEACLWLGSTGTVRRVSVRRCGLVGIWTGTANRESRIEDAAVDRTRVGIYIEHYTTGSTFQRLRVGPRVSRGVNAEWANHAVGGRPASVDNVIEDCYFDTSVVGVYLDEGTTRTSVRRCKFAAQRWAAIGDYKGVDNRYYANDFRGIASTAVSVSHEHSAGAR
jgi:hypothetical protein